MAAAESTDAQRPSQTPSTGFAYQESQEQQNTKIPTHGLHTGLSVRSQPRAGSWASLDPTVYACKLWDAGRACGKLEKLSSLLVSELEMGHGTELSTPLTKALY